ncbi:MAG: DUF4124 domain-containing protein [Methylococcaceae bacterium]|nr:DUF4124 domain-containing protein [Methylococcaceae bacterium]
MPKATLAVFFLLSWGWDSARGEAYHWIDEFGNVHYSDRLPPEQAQYKREKLNKEGRTIAVIEGAKTAEQLAIEKRLKQLRLDQQRILAEQKERDASMLKTYHSEEEMQMALQGKLNTIESAIKVSDINRQNQEEILQSQIQRAAEIELSGQPVSKNLRDSIELTRRQIAAYQEKSRSLENSKADTLKSFGKELDRFKSLLALRSSPVQGILEWREPAVDVGILSAIGCGRKVCDIAWALARNYVQLKSGKPLVTETDTLLQTVAPHEEKDIAMLVVRIAGKTEDSLFLDTSCQPSSIGDEVCKGDEVRQIRSGFVPFIEDGLKAGRR